MTPTASNNIVSHTIRRNQQQATLQLQNNPSLGPASSQVPMGAANVAGLGQNHQNAPLQNFEREQNSGSVSSSFKESVKPFHIPTTPGGYPHPNQQQTNVQGQVVYNHSSLATPVSNISNQLLLAQQQVSQFEVTGGNDYLRDRSDGQQHLAMH